MDLALIGHALSVWFLPVVVAITFHEAAHGWMAERCGDNTARLLGRVSFNPIRHVDPFGTLILPALLLLLKAPFLFGYAKPVPVNFGRLRHPKRDMIWVALAGPAVNILLAFAAALLLHPAAYAPLPLPPLDGGRVMTGLLPGPAAWRFARLEPYGLLILIGLLFLVPLAARSLLGIEFNPLFDVLWPPVAAVYSLILTLTGLS